MNALEQKDVWAGMRDWFLAFPVPMVDGFAMGLSLEAPDPAHANDRRWQRSLPYRWWRRTVVSPIDHKAIVDRLIDESRWSARYLFMTMMSAGIAVLGLLLSSPAVIIGAMLISPLMSPILGLGFSLAMFDSAELKRASFTIALGAAAAVCFTALIVLLSPIQQVTAEILSRTRPTLFDLFVALFSALAGSVALIRGRGDTIVGVAIATALMPPLAVIGFGVATGNMAVTKGAFGLFATNLLTIALAATLVSRFFGFGHHLSGRQSWMQTIVMFATFAMMAVPLAISLNRIARETLLTAEVRATLSDSFGPDARVSQLELDLQARPIGVRAVVIAPREKAIGASRVERRLAATLGQPVQLDLDQILLDPAADPTAAQQVELAQAAALPANDGAEGRRVAQFVSVATGYAPETVTVDQLRRRAVLLAQGTSDGTAADLQRAERRIAAAAPGWTIIIVPPVADLPRITFQPDSAELGDAAREQIALAAWQARRWQLSAVSVSGLAPDDARAAPPTLGARRAKAVADALVAQGVAVAPGPAAGTEIVLAPSGDPRP